MMRMQDTNEGRGHPNPATRSHQSGAHHLSIRAVPAALHVLLGDIEGVPGLLPLQQRLLLPSAHRLHQDITGGETPQRPPH